MFQIWESGQLDIIISRQTLLCLSQYQEHVSISGLSKSSFPTFLPFHSFHYTKQVTSPEAPSRFLPCFCSHFTVPGAAILPVQAQEPPIGWSTATWVPCYPCKNQSSCWWAPVRTPASTSPSLPTWHRLSLYLLEQSLAVNRSEVESPRWTHTLAIFPTGDHR